MNWTKVLDQVSKIEIKSITDSVFRYGALCLTLGIVGAIFKAPNWTLIVTFGLAGLFCITGLCSYWYFSIKNPDYLRSESFQLRKQSIEILGDKDNQISSNASNIVLITNPYIKQISEKSSSLTPSNEE